MWFRVAMKDAVAMSRGHESWPVMQGCVDLPEEVGRASELEPCSAPPKVEPAEPEPASKGGKKR